MPSFPSSYGSFGNVYDGSSSFSPPAPVSSKAKSSCSNGKCMLPSRTTSRSSHEEYQHSSTSPAVPHAATKKDSDTPTLLLSPHQSLDEWIQFLKTSPLTLVYVFKPSCSPCSILHPEVAQWASIYASRNVSVFKVDITEDQLPRNPNRSAMTTTMYHWEQTEAVPCFFLYAKTKLVYKTNYKEEVLEKLEELLEGISPSHRDSRSLCIS